MLIESPWIKEIPAHTIYGAMMDASKDYTQYFKKKNNEKTSKPKCSRKKQRSFYILGNAITEKGIYSRLLGEMKSYEKIPDKPSDSRILYINRKWYLRIPVKKTCTISESQGRVVSIDPGVRTFLTCFSDKSITKIGEGQFQRIFKLLLSADKLKSKISGLKGKQKYRTKLAFSKMLRRIQTLVDDMHYQSISWLTNNFDVIIFPEGDFTGAIEKGKRKIRSKTVRSLMTWAMARFRDRLRDKCELMGKHFIIQEESYTSKTANWTGEIKNIGGAKIIKSGGMSVDRDINGALGITLKALLAQPAVQTGSLHLLTNINEK
jgi:putative transposase